jgi:hypothetical protein
MLSLTTLALLMSCDGCAPATEPVDSVTSERRVVVLVLDGVRLEESLGDGYSDALDMPTAEILPGINSLIDNHGARITGAMASGMTLTGPGHSDLLTGLRHSFANYPADDGPGAYLPELPSLLSALPEGQAVLATNSALVTPLSDSTSPLAVSPAVILEADSDRAVLNELRGHLSGSDVRLVVANLHQADSQGHFGPAGGYGEKVLDLDSSITGFWSWLRDEPGWRETTLVLVADHGRHRRDEEEGWREHSDHCVGCREIPMALVGAGIAAGAVVDEPHTLEDLGQTIAWILELPMPYGTGRVIDAALEEPSGDPGARGAVAPAAAGDVLAWEERTGEVDPRSVVLRDGVQVSDPDAFAAEAPVLVADGEDAAACWRELHVEGTEIWPWKPACQLRDSGGKWQDIGGPAELVWALWQPGLALHDGDLLAGWADNSSGVVMEEASMLVLSRWHPGDGWRLAFATPAGSFPSDPTLVIDGDDALLAAAVGEEGLPGRDSRRIDLYRIDTTTDQGALALSIRPQGAEEDGDFRLPVDRLEHPALWSGGGSVRLAFISTTIDTDGRPRVDLWMSTEEAAPELLDTDLLGHLPPVFDEDGTPRWIRQRDGVVALCVGSAADCTALDTEAVRGVAVTDAGTTVSVLEADRRWSLIER